MPKKDAPVALTDLADDDLRARVAELEEERFRLQFRGATETLDDPLRLRWIRRDVARLKTELRARALRATEAVRGGEA
jgi:large subunit ribosomal protein L29